ncbi:MAG: hypothetical protein AB1637_03600 [Elusimicrobiota bacterium]
MEKKKIERAFFIHGLWPENNVKLKKNFICLGSEFCSKLIAGEAELKKALSYDPAGICLYTSFLSQKEFEENTSFLKAILKKFPDTEVMINDPGLLLWLNENFPKVKKGIARPLSVEFMRMPYEKLKIFMSENKLSSLETDEADLLKNFPKKRAFSVYLRKEYVFSAMSRFCPFTRKISGNCLFECKKGKKIFSVPKSSVKIISYEKAYFTLSKGNVDIFSADRIVEDIFDKV